MPVFQGHILLPDRVHEGWIHVEGGRIVDLGDATHADAVATGWIIPSPVNAHTHVGDAFLYGEPKPRNVATLVGPGGWKHQRLATADTGVMRKAIEAHVEAMAAQGQTAFIDFREGGVTGADLLRDLELPMTAHIRGRPRGRRFDPDEADALLPVVDGIGWSGVRDHHSTELEQWVDACQAARKPWSIHVSEDKRDDIEAVIALEPDHVVHMCHGRPADFEALADADIPVVACPRSNRWFAQPTPFEAMQKAGVRIALGTDNAMLHDGDLVKEASHAIGSDEQRIRMMVEGRRIIGLPWPSLKKGVTADWIVLPENPFGPPRRKPGMEPNLDPEAWRALDAKKRPVGDA